MGGLLLGVIQEYMVSASLGCVFMGPKELTPSMTRRQESENAKSYQVGRHININARK